MPILKTRPEITLYAPNPIVAGHRFTARIVLRCPEAVPVDEVQVELVGQGVWFATSQYGSHRQSLPFTRFVASPVSQRTDLRAGEHEFTVSFDIPADAPSSYSGRHLSIEWLFKVRAAIPWWPDARGTFVAIVVSPPAGPPRRRAFTSSPDGPQGTKPYAEVALSPVVPGEVLRGKIALSNTANNDYRALKFALVAVETVPGLFSSWTQRSARTKWSLRLDKPQENQSIGFRLYLPEDITPSFRTRRLALEWGLEIQIDIAWKLDTVLWIPVDVQPAAAQPGQEISVPPAVGSDRLARVWADAGKETGFNYREGELSREIGGARLSIRRERRGRAGLRLMGEVTFADLDLGLAVETGKLVCRDPRQSEILHESLEPVLGTLAIGDADDGRIVCWFHDSGTRLEQVVQAAEQLVALWEKVSATLDSLPAPHDMAAAVPRFRSAARRLGGELFIASMDIRGVRDEIPFGFDVQWSDDGQVIRTLLSVEPALPIDGRWHQRWDGQGDPGAVPEGVESLLEGALGLTIDDKTLRLVLPPCGHEPDPYVDRLEGLIAVARRLSGQGAGYR